MSIDILHLKWYLMALAVLFYSCESATYHYDSGSTWGTIYNIKYLSDRNLSDSIVVQLQSIDNTLSPFQPQSLISKINRGDSVNVQGMFADVFLLSQQICKASGGLFDPTVSPLVNLWGFGYDKGAADCPTQAQIDSALVTVGILDCSIDSAGYLIRKHSDTKFNFSAVAKGYGIDRVAQMMRRNGCNDYMIEIGGEIALSGNGPSGNGWSIQIDAPTSTEGTIEHKRLNMLQLTDACIATSGNYRNHRTTSKGEVGHTISPVTGQPVTSTTLSATVIAETTALADALATAIMAMPDTAALNMVNALGVDALIVKASADSDYEIITTPDFDAYLK